MFFEKKKLSKYFFFFYKKIVNNKKKKNITAAILNVFTVELLLNMERPKRQSAIEKDYRERKRQKKGDNNEKVQKFVALFQFLFIFPIKKKSRLHHPSLQQQ